MNDIVLQTFDLTKRFHDDVLDVEVLKGISLQVSSGETIAILGASGSGKSTLLHLLGGLDEPTTGRAEVCGRDLADFNEDESATFKVYLNPMVSWLWTGGWIIALGTVVSVWPDRLEQRRRIERIKKQETVFVPAPAQE